MTEARPTETIANIALSYRFERLPEDVVLLAHLAILDNLGCALRGVKEPLVQFIADELFGKSITGFDLLPGKLAGPLHNQAMLHAAAAHAIDFDDTLPPALAAHAGSAVVGAVLPLATELGTSGKHLLTSVIAGYETAARIGDLLHSDHYLLGFHPTATVGVFGAAAAAGYLMDFNETQMRAALGMAATQACGLKCTFGTMAKPYNAAHAASAGVLSARLASRGFTAPTNALEADKGYLKMFLGKQESDYATPTNDAFAIRKNAFKFHAACHATHPMIEALSELKVMHNFTPNDVKQVHVQTSELGLKTASIGTPTSGLECKFSFSQVAALTLADKNTSADETFEDAILLEENVNALRERVQVTGAANEPTVTTVTITTKSGEHFSAKMDFLDLMKDTANVTTRLKTKFLTNSTPVIGETNALALQQDILSLTTLANVSDIFG